MTGTLTVTETIISTSTKGTLAQVIMATEQGENNRKTERGRRMAMNDG